MRSSRAHVLRIHRTTSTEGWSARITLEVFAGLSFPPPPTPKTERFDAPVLATNTHFPSDVIPPEAGPTPVEIVAGDNAVKAPVAAPKAYCEIWKEPFSIT